MATKARPVKRRKGRSTGLHDENLCSAGDHVKGVKMETGVNVGDPRS